jgi:hypothetical protein
VSAEKQHRCMPCLVLALRELELPPCTRCMREARALEQIEPRPHPARFGHRATYRRVAPNGECFERCRCGATRTQPHGGEFTPWERAENE